MNLSLSIRILRSQSKITLQVFSVTMMKMIKKNDTSYVYILALEFIGIVINFIELIFNLKLNLFFRVLIYILSVILLNLTKMEI